MALIEKLRSLSIDVILLAIVCLSWVAVGLGYQLKGIMPAGARVWTAGAGLILAMTILAGWLETRKEPT